MKPGTILPDCKAAPNARPAHIILSAVTISLCAIASACSGSEKPKTEAAPSPLTIEAKQQQLAKVPPPDLSQAQQAVKRIFKDSVVVEVSRQPSFVAGDFNGDLSQDLAVILKPASGKSGALNEELAAWLIRDPFRPSDSVTPPLRIEEDEVLLAIIHGYGADGWRDVQATQTFLLKNAVGSEIGVKAGKEFVAANTGSALPRIYGDVISEAIRGTPGCLYYAGPTYSWYDPKTFKGDSSARVGHGRSPAMKP